MEERKGGIKVIINTEEVLKNAHPGNYLDQMDLALDTEDIIFEFQEQVDKQIDPNKHYNSNN